MKGQTVGATGLLWPSNKAMLDLREISCQDYILEETTPLDLLWPASLINEQARSGTRRSWAIPLATFAFILSIIAAFIIGPLQMILVAAILDYNWVTIVYFPNALHFTLIATGFIALIGFVGLILSWRTHPKPTYVSATLILGSLIEIALIWISGRITSWAPHVLSLILLIVAASFIIAALLINKQFFRKAHNSPFAKTVLSLLMVFALTEAILSAIYVFEPAFTHNPAEVEQLATAHEQAQLPGVSRNLSDLTYVLCNSPYQLIYQAQDGDSGLFECSNSGEVYSVQETPERSNKSVFGAAMYLGTTHDGEVSLAFPNARYLYRTLPNTSAEAELVLMYPAASEQELVDNIVQPLLGYWQKHHDQNLFINIFYNDDFSQVNSTRDFVLMAALDTMVMTASLPRGNTLQGYFNGIIAPYYYEADTALKALRELGSTPELYANSSRIALTDSRHISLHLAAKTELTSETLRELLQNSFVGGIE